MTQLTIFSALLRVGLGLSFEGLFSRTSFLPKILELECNCFLNSPSFIRKVWFNESFPHLCKLLSTFLSLNELAELNLPFSVGQLIFKAELFQQSGWSAGRLIWKSSVRVLPSVGLLSFLYKYTDGVLNEVPKGGTGCSAFFRSFLYFINIWAMFIIRFFK